MTGIERRAAVAARTSTTAGTPPPSTGNDTTVEAEDIGALAASSPRDAVERGTRASVDVHLDAADGDIRTTGYELHGPPPPPRAPRSTCSSIDEASAALRTTFGVQLAAGAWSLEALSRLHETFSTLGPVEREALRGLVLKREGVPADGVGHGAGPAGAVFRRGDAVDDAGRRIEGASITFYDAAFPDSGDDAVDRQATMIVVLHEVGHALDGHAIGELVAEQRAGQKLAQQVINVEDTTAPRYREVTTALAAFPIDKALAPLRAAQREWERAHRAFSRDGLSPTAQARALAWIERAQARVAAAVDALPPEHPARATARTLADLDADLTTQQRSDAEARRRGAEQALVARGAMPDDIRTPADETLGPLELALLEVAPQTTTYGATSPVENFAEAYMLYKRDPAKLRQQDNGEAALRFFRTHFPP
jgi:hypothetical protein